MWVDEAGRWAWAWPVVSAAVFWQWRCPIRSLLRDSKKMTSLEREKTYYHIINLAARGKLVYDVGIISNESIDSLGIREANRCAMQVALDGICNKKFLLKNIGFHLYIDGRDNYQFDILWIPTPEYIVRGDSKIKQIMAASIIAKVTRDHFMQNLDTRFPGYGFAQHKWYGTVLHQGNLQKNGICSIHRRSYNPIRTLIQK